MPTRDEYLSYSVECIALAQKAADGETRARLLDRAQAWRDLAEKLRERRPPEDSP
jgi:hypothetical protein